MVYYDDCFLINGVIYIVSCCIFRRNSPACTEK